MLWLGFKPTTRSLQSRQALYQLSYQVTQLGEVSIFKVPVRGCVRYSPIGAYRDSCDSSSCVEYSAAIFAAISAVWPEF